MNFSSVSIPGNDLVNHLNNYPDGILILILNMESPTNARPVGFIYNRGAGRRFIPLNFKPESPAIPIPSYPAILATLKWKYGEDADVGFEFDPAVTYYLHASVARRRLVYYFSESSIPELLGKLGTSIEEFKKSDPKKQQEILDALQRLLAAGSGGSFNPVPPKLVP